MEREQSEPPDGRGTARTRMGQRERPRGGLAGRRLPVPPQGREVPSVEGLAWVPGNTSTSYKSPREMLQLGESFIMEEFDLKSHGS